jgi:predicted nucleic acid-binding protein
MNGKSFLDTNIFVYNIDSDAPQAKKNVAYQLIRDALTEHRSVVSYQVLQEFLAVAVRKFSSAVTLPDARRYLETVLKPLLAVHSSVELFREALDICSRYQLSWYDSLIVAAASEANCSVLYTEDLQHGAKINGVRIENPFRAKRAN